MQKSFWITKKIFLVNYLRELFACILFVMALACIDALAARPQGRNVETLNETLADGPSRDLASRTLPSPSVRNPPLNASQRASNGC